MTTIALFGAGGKMGYRLASNFKKSAFDVRHVEVSPAGRERLSELGVQACDQAMALEGADVVILAVPDTVIGKVAASINNQLQPVPWWWSSTPLPRSPAICPIDQI